MSTNPANVAIDEGRCPSCGDADSLGYSSYDADGGKVWQVASCGVCGAEWAEVYVPDSIYIRESGDDEHALAMDAEFTYERPPVPRAPSVELRPGDRVRFVNDEVVPEGSLGTLRYAHAASGIWIVAVDSDPALGWGDDDHYICAGDSFVRETEKKVT